MYISPRILRSLAWSAIAISAAQAQSVIETLSFGHKDGQLSPNLRGIPGWHLSGENHNPDILSDHVILTPPYPGNKRGALWTDGNLDRTEWNVELSFRASGPERGGGNMQIWLVKNGQNEVGLNSIYTASKFDGLVLVLDQYGGKGGSIRGFLNDGSVSFRDHHNVDQLAFGLCDYPYRNRGRLSTLQFKQTATDFQVMVDNRECFKSDKIKLPVGYQFGISAASAENPDSFEIYKFMVSAISMATREEPKRPPPVPRGGQEQQGQPQNSGQQPIADSIPDEIPDQPASAIEVNAQFADLHNRIQVANHQVSNIWREIQTLRRLFDEQKQEMGRQQQDRHLELMNRLIPAHEHMMAVERTVQRIESIVRELKTDVASKDYKDHLHSLQNQLEKAQQNLLQTLPQHMTNIVATSAPKMTTLLFIFLAVQAMMLGVYITYKRRREMAPKKYL